ncbi:oxidoreductase [Spirosoma sordidisoli]|uniref:SDR family NAD(P)-dependent oxidoreductase n=1 Tax=Spirosoma sordidisoli TaxID=2502893 RepID=A0A4Q2UGB5_9BACT|nr:oxidoreductase [Spirosoma sordidisoli]RYC68046.1 SDR family NAD(P)-dependent oxidoreductase [Spirosoma sordidisoli]
MSKVILITGASSGMGKETAKTLIAEGHKVYVAARRIDQMQDLQRAGGIALQLDVTNEENIQQVVDTIIEREGKIDVLFNNAGYAIYGSVEEIPIQEARRQFEVNVFGLASLTQKVIPFMREARSGTIINTSSMGGKMYTPMGAWYHASKHAIEGWSDCLRLELSQFNIQVVILEPGLIATEFGDVMSGPMVARSGSGPYANIVKGVASAASMAMSPASVIAKTVSAIVRSRKPKTRYRVGSLAKPMVWMRVNLGDRLFDKIIMSQVN